MRRFSCARRDRSGWRRARLRVGFGMAVSGRGAAAASAHATLVGADPAPGASLPQAPGAVVLHFSEAVDRARSTVTVTGPGGRDATVGPSEGVPSDGRAVRRPLGLERPGRYDVTWTSVSLDDGPLETGRYS